MKTDGPRYHFLHFLCFSLILGCIVLAKAAEKVRTPEEFFGLKVGADLHLIDYDQAVAYWKELEQSVLGWRHPLLIKVRR